MSALTIGPGLRGGDVTVAGHKHAAVVVLAAAAGAGTRAALGNLPRIDDALVMAEILERGGARARWRDRTLDLDTSALDSPEIPEELGRRVHGALYLVPALLGRFGSVHFGRFGGCPIGPAEAAGERPVSHVLDVLERFGASFDTSGSRTRGRASVLKGTTIDIADYSSAPGGWSGPFVSGATKTALLAAAAASGTSVVRNPNPKDEIGSLARFLAACGHDVDASPDRIAVAPRRGAPPDSTRHELTGDLSEIMTYLVASVLLDVPVRVNGPRMAEARRGLAPELALLAEMGVEVTWDAGSVAARATGPLRAVDVVASGRDIYTDHQPLFALLLLQADGTSTIVDRVWDNRFGYARELAKLGARVAVDGNRLSIAPSRLRSPDGHLVAHDVRAAATLVLAGLSTDGGCVVEGTEHLDRGYADLVGALRGLGADIRPAPLDAASGSRSA